MSSSLDEVAIPATQEYEAYPATQAVESIVEDEEDNVESSIISTLTDSSFVPQDADERKDHGSSSFSDSDEDNSSSAAGSSDSEPSDGISLDDLGKTQAQLLFEPTAALPVHATLVAMIKAFFKEVDGGYVATHIPTEKERRMENIDVKDDDAVDNDGIGLVVDDYTARPKGIHDRAADMFSNDDLMKQLSEAFCDYMLPFFFPSLEDEEYAENSRTRKFKSARSLLTSDAVKALLLNTKAAAEEYRKEAKERHRARKIRDDVLKQEKKLEELKQRTEQSLAKAKRKSEELQNQAKRQRKVMEMQRKEELEDE